MNSKLAVITFLESGPVDPGYGVPGFGGYPDQGLPGGSGGHPWLPGHLGGPRPDQGLPGGGAHPWFPGRVGGPRPDQGLPGSGNYPTTGPVPTPPPVTPDNSLPTTPSTPPPQISLPIYLPPSTKPIEPDAAWELKYSVRFGWVLVPIEDDAVAQPKK